MATEVSPAVYGSVRVMLKSPEPEPRVLEGLVTTCRTNRFFAQYPAPEEETPAQQEQAEEVLVGEGAFGRVVTK